MSGYEFLPHTADIKIRAWGTTLEEAFEKAAEAFTDTTVDINTVTPKMRDELTVYGDDLEELLYNFIEELIVRLDSEGKVYSRFKTKIDREDGRYVLHAEMWGENLDLNKHEPKIHVKAMTYHEMKIDKEDGRYVIEYVLDI